MYPQINRTPLYRVIIPEFSTGVNYRDSFSLVDDNQLTDVKNMWYQKAMLRTRPGLCTEEDNYFATILYDDDTELNEITSDVRTTDVYRTVNGVKQRLIMAFVKNEKMHPDRVKFAFVGEDGSVARLSSLPYIVTSDLKQCPDLENCIAFMNGDDLWLLTQYGGQADDVRPNGFKYDFEADVWKVLSDEDFYAPTIFINGTAQKMIINNEKYSTNGDMIESYNLLGNKYKVYFDGYADAGNTRFVLPTTLANCKKIEVKHTAADKNVYTHTFNWDLGSIPVEHSTVDMGGGVWAYLGATGVQDDGVRLVVANMGEEDLIAIYFIDADNKAVEGFSNESGLDNNIEVTVYTKDLYCDVARCKFSTWYGGNASGLNGGTRLFVAGDSEHPNRILWSDLNNPLYFPENNYAYIGNDDQAVTAFGKQGEMLVIFKEREIYYTYYVPGNSTTAEDVINQKVIDLAANSATFPVIQIHSEIGCDCPGTVALCQNRLVWVTSTGKVYTLANNNQYSELNAVEISGLLGQKLREIGSKTLKSACAADCDEHYYIAVENRVFVLDYGNNGLSYMASYGGYDSAVKRLAWYIWELPCCIDMIASCGLALIAASVFIKDTGSSRFSYTTVFRFSDNEYKDTLLECEIGNMFMTVGKDTNMNEIMHKTQKDISCMLQTKTFDFKRADCNKKIYQIYIQLGNCEKPVTVVFYTDKEDVYDCKILKKIKSGDIETLRILPQLPHISRFGIMMECEGVFSLDGITINYKPLGSVM